MYRLQMIHSLIECVKFDRTDLDKAGVGCLAMLDKCLIVCIVSFLQMLYVGMNTGTSRQEV
jgi:hypothetical protein